MKPKSSNSTAGRTFARARLLGNICELHKKKEILSVNTCPVCLLHIHKNACKERDNLRELLASFPGFDVPCDIGDPWIEKVRAMLPNDRTERPARQPEA